MSGLLLAARGGDIFEFVVVAIIFLFAAAVRWLAQARNVAPPRPRPPPDQAVAQQIDEFLQRAAQRRRPGRPAAPAQTPPPVTAEVVPDEPVGGRIGRRVREDLDTSDFRRRGTQMGGEVVQSDKEFQQHVGQAFSGEVSRLAKQPGEAAEPAETAAEETAPAAATGPVAAPLAQPALAGLFSSPDSIVNAIILSEILRRPE
ncbi:MAG: hypothetical protein ABSG86_31485 [Thermoguttaceae bacterium]|jgi:hypothetical protein